MSHTEKSSTSALALAALGVVYGDIGTSPLYAFKTAFGGIHGLDPSPLNVLGLLSLIFWALIVVISIKYIGLMLMADNRGEGGVLALTTLVLRGRPGIPRSVIVALGLFGAVLFFGDGAITPAISVLSAVEGLQIVSPKLDAYVLPVSAAVLVGLFVVQKRGTGQVGRLFGPVMIGWFITLAAIGLVAVIRNPIVTEAFNPWYAVRFIGVHVDISLVVMAAVFLAVTGGEALYADMGHFGRAPIRLAWFGLVLPALMLNYLGQGAVVLATPEAARNPFYLLAPSWMLLPLVVLAMAATVIASQAVISGVFSIVRQAVQLSLLPRMKIVHSSEEAIGQVYVPSANWALLASTLGLVMAFQSSENLAGAYGIAISVAMTIDSILLFIWLSYSGRKRARAGQVLVAVILVVDVVFVLANGIKIPHGGWLPLVAGTAMFVLMMTWQQGRVLSLNAMVRQQLPLRTLLKALDKPGLFRAPGTAVYLEGSEQGVPRALVRNLQVNNVVHERVVLMTVLTDEVPHTERSRRVEVSELAPGLHRVVAHVGFMDSPHVPTLLREAQHRGLDYRPSETTFFLGRENVAVTRPTGMAHWRKRLYAFLNRNAQLAAEHFSLPPTRVVEIGEQVEI
ncbi:MAG: potassium transporter Kup [Steroidobacteraceae bacterium]|nr:potassium transporter Kup [Steroidobacteraceae bacterium]